MLHSCSRFALLRSIKISIKMTGKINLFISIMNLKDLALLVLIAVTLDLVDAAAKGRDKVQAEVEIYANQKCSGTVVRKVIKTYDDQNKCLKDLKESKKRCKGKAKVVSCKIPTQRKKSGQKKNSK
jgi:hypothetical protein